MTWKLFLDDERFPAEKDTDFTIARSCEEAITLMQTHGCPVFVSFDHDLGLEKSGYDLAKYIVEQDLDSNLSFIPKEFSFYVHSQNNVGAKNIQTYLTQYLEMHLPLKESSLKSPKNKF
jgi:hypothetical protein